MILKKALSETLSYKFLRIFLISVKIRKFKAGRAWTLDSPFSDAKKSKEEKNVFLQNSSSRIVRRRILILRRRLCAWELWLLKDSRGGL